MSGRFSLLSRLRHMAARGHRAVVRVAPPLEALYRVAYRRLWPLYRRLAVAALPKGETTAAVEIATIDGATERLHLLVDASQTLGRDLLVHGVFEPEETRLVLELLRPGDVFVDVGANIGYFSVLAARRVGTTGAVLAIEPEPRNLALLRRNLERHALGETVTVAPVAVGEHPGTARFEVPSERTDARLAGDQTASSEISTTKTTFDVEVTTLDDLVGTLTERTGAPPALVKIDIQGGEARCLEGFARTLADPTPPPLLLELWPFGLERDGRSTARELFDRLHEHYGLHAYRLASADPAERGRVEVTSFDEIEPLCRGAWYASVNLLFSRRALPTDS
ncbi:MAG: FkbM family methyltransferase [Acidobacteriota bacterium]